MKYKITKKTKTVEVYVEIPLDAAPVQKTPYSRAIYPNNYKEFYYKTAKKILREEDVPFGQVVEGKKMILNNGDADKCSGTWVFELLSSPADVKPATPKKPRARSRKKSPQSKKGA
tara:strand:- start:812 stop:1159 length:348 start_codon:yes stop_codon:yes gene_type:complete